MEKKVERKITQRQKLHNEIKTEFAQTAKKKLENQKSCQQIQQRNYYALK
jgi:hypothetical protein